MSGRLGYSKAECEKIIGERIQEVRDLMAAVERNGANFDEELEKFSVELTGWREINNDILKRMFPDPSIAKKYDESSSGGFHMVVSDNYEVYEGYKREVAQEIGYLQTCLKKLNFYSEPESTHHVFTAGQPFTALAALNDIVRKATKSIILVDGYIDDKTLSILTIKNSGVHLSILTKAKSGNQLEVRTSEDYHDRFIVIDDNEVYQPGGSIKDLGGKTTTLLQLTTPQIVGPLIKQIKSDWASAPAL
jgi:hypothetical protein